jgi:cellulose synthase/poly-beta-1,6-N-acetylglucosamine synthase-like glycosyltransferase
MIFILLFWIFLFIIIYAYLGYTAILSILVLFKKIFTRKYIPSIDPWEPEVTLLVPAYNEKKCIESKIKNSLGIDYPADKLHLVWVTDGSNDGSPEILRKYKNVKVLHENERKGKINAMNRAVKNINTPIIVFSDANTDLNKNSIKEIVEIFKNDTIGCVAGEKRITQLRKDKAVSAGEGLYWQYESVIKTLESELNSVMGAVGELFAIRTELYDDVEEDSLLDDFVISLKIVKKGYKIKYAPNAYACESASLSIREELKRKVRIACGGLQTLFRMIEMLNIFKYGLFSFQYFSHKVLRWTLVPLSFILIFIFNIAAVWFLDFNMNLYMYIIIVQLLFYFMIILGTLIKNFKIRFKILFIPYYIFIMNYSIIRGMFRYISGTQSVIWEKAKRS